MEIHNESTHNSKKREMELPDNLQLIQVPIPYSLSSHQLPHVLQHLLSQSLFQLMQIPFMPNLQNGGLLQSNFQRSNAHNPSNCSGIPQSNPFQFSSDGSESERTESPSSKRSEPKKRVSQVDKKSNKYLNTLNHWCIDLLYAMEYHSNGDVVCCLSSGSLSSPEFILFFVFRNVFNSCIMSDNLEMDSFIDRQISPSNHVKKRRRSLSRNDTLSESINLSEKQLGNIIRTILRNMMSNDCYHPLQRAGKNYFFVWISNENQGNFSGESQINKQMKQSDPVSVWNENTYSIESSRNVTKPIVDTQASTFGVHQNLFESYHMKNRLRFKIRNQKQRIVVLEIGKKEYLDEDSTRGWIEAWIENKIRIRSMPKLSSQNRKKFESDTIIDMQTYKPITENAMTFNGSSEVQKFSSLCETPNKQLSHGDVKRQATHEQNYFHHASDHRYSIENRSWLLHKSPITGFKL